eukprot:gene47-48503_t
MGNTVATGADHLALVARLVPGGGPGERWASQRLRGGEGAWLSIDPVLRFGVAYVLRFSAVGARGVAPAVSRTLRLGDCPEGGGACAGARGAGAAAGDYCAPGSAGHLCQGCAPGYARSRGVYRCSRCSGWQGVAYAMLMAVFFVVIVSWTTRSQRRAAGIGRRIIVLRHGIVYLQLMGKFADYSRNKRMFAFLTGGFREDRWFWPVVVLGREAGIVIPSLVLTDKSEKHLQHVVGLLVMQTALVLQLVAQPFATPMLNGLESRALLASASVMCLTLVAHSRDAHGGLVKVWMLLALAVFVSAAALYAYHLLPRRMIDAVDRVAVHPAQRAWARWVLGALVGVQRRDGAVALRQVDDDGASSSDGDRVPVAAA